MSLFVSSLNSGSNGNCYYVGNKENAILIDAGISCRQTEKRMKRLGLNIRKVRAIFVSHEHTDHVYGVPGLVKKYKIPVYITPKTLAGSNLLLDNNLICNFTAYEPMNVGNITVTAFPKLHDASDPHSFVVASHNVKVGIFTDIGNPCEHVIRNFNECHAAFLETNYDEYLLEKGGYPYPLKVRIRGDKGHLSNDQAAELFRHHRAPYMSHLFLSHLSSENNRPKIVEGLFKKMETKTKIILAPRHKETQLYHIRDTFHQMQQQLSLF